MDPRGILKAFPKRKKIHAHPSSKALAKIPKREEGEEAGGELVYPQNCYIPVIDLVGQPYIVPESDNGTGATCPRPADLFVSAVY
jgi:hypothetical protein